jgi:hypothetical protein
MAKMYSLSETLYIVGCKTHFYSMFSQPLLAILDPGLYL